MWSFLVHPNHYKKKIYFVFYLVRETKIPSLSIKERKAKTPSFLAPSKKYTMIKEFKDELRGLKNILNDIKNWNYWENKK